MATLGLGVASDRVSAVLVVRHAIRWYATRTRDDTTPLADLLVGLVTECPRSRYARPHIVAAIGPAGVQLKRVTELPEVAEPRALAAMIHESANRFFLKNGEPLVTSGVRVTSAGGVWVAAFDASLVAAIEHACHPTRRRLRAIVPTAVVLPHAINERHVTWDDGDVRLSVVYSGDHITDLRRLYGSGVNGHARPTPIPALQAIGPQASDLLDAYAATQLSKRETLVLVGSGSRHHVTPSNRRLRVAALVAVVALAWSFASPGFAAWYGTHTAERRLAVLAPRVRTLRERAATLARTTTALGDLASFVAERRSMTLLLTEIARALPDGCVLVELRITDTGEGTLVGLASRAAQVVDAIERVPDLDSPEIVGPITQESAAGHTLERVTVRFRLTERSESSR